MPRVRLLLALAAVVLDVAGRVLVPAGPVAHGASGTAGGFGCFG